MELSDAVKIRIQNLLKQYNLNVSQLSTKAGISRSTLSKLLAGKHKYIRLDIVEYICEALNIKLSAFFADSIFNNINIQD